jgi:hypothetical protein
LARWIAALAIGSCLFALGAYGETYVELDADGILGNGPDTLAAGVGSPTGVTESSWGSIKELFR